MNAPVATQPTDRALLRRYAAERDIESFHELVRRHQGDLLRLAHAILGEADAAQDAVQETFLRLIHQVAALRTGGDGLGGWLTTVCRNHCLDVLRHRQVARCFSIDAIEPASAREPEAIDGAPVWRAVGALPALERAAVTLRYRDGLAYADIAARLGKSATHVGLLLHQAIGRLRRCPGLQEGS